jgi:hypothetical protein
MDKFAREISAGWHGKERRNPFEPRQRKTSPRGPAPIMAQDFHLFRDGHRSCCQPRRIFVSGRVWSRPQVSAPRRNNLLATRRCKALMCNPHGAASGIGHSLEARIARQARQTRPTTFAQRSGYNRNTDIRLPRIIPPRCPLF